MDKVLNIDNKIKKKFGIINSLLFLLIVLPIIIILLAFIIFLAPFLLIGFIFYSYFNFKKETLIIKQKHTRALNKTF